MILGQLLAQARLVFAQRGDASSHRGDMLADGEVDALHERGVDLPVVCRQHLLDRPEGAEHHAVTDAHQTPAAQTSP
jgi:hypothetical protein